MSATTWPDPAVELLCARQPDWPLAQLALVDEVPSGGPRAPLPAWTVAGPSLPDAEVRVVPEQPALPPQSRVASAIVHEDAPGTVGAPEFALEPGAVGAGGVTGCCSWAGRPCCRSAGAWSPVVPEVTVAFSVDRACTSGAMLFASGADDAAELVIAWHTPPETPSQEPSECEPRGSGDNAGSVAVAALATVPVHDCPSSHVSAAPAADAADGPVPIRAAFHGWAAPDGDCAFRACAAPGPDDAVDTDRTSHPAPPVQEAVPVEVRGAPPATAPSQAALLVCTVPTHPVGQSSAADDDDVDDGPLDG
jgi:hypothetical protein